MIYLKFSEWVQKNFGIPEIVADRGRSLPYNARYYADFIFEFNAGATVYIKDRHDSNYQYTEDEQIMIVLQAQSI